MSAMGGGFRGFRCCSEICGCNNMLGFIRIYSNFPILWVDFFSLVLRHVLCGLGGYVRVVRISVVGR